MTADDRRVGTDRRSPTHPCLSVFVPTVDVRARVDHVGKHHGRTAKDIILEDHTGVQTHVVLNFTIVTDHHSICDINVLTKATIPSDHSLGVHMAKVPHTTPGADDSPVIHHSGLMNERLVTQGLSPIPSRGDLPLEPGRVNVIDPFRVSP